MVARSAHMKKCLKICLLVSVITALETKESGEATQPPRPGTQCELLSREVLTRNSATPAVHRLRFSLPRTAKIPMCCDGEDMGMIHVHVKAPDESGQMRVQPYSAHVDGSNQSLFDLYIKIYPRGSPSNPGVSSYLGGVPVGEQVHIPVCTLLDC